MDRRLGKWQFPAGRGDNQKSPNDTDYPNGHQKYYGAQNFQNYLTVTNNLKTADDYVIQGFTAAESIRDTVFI